MAAVDLPPPRRSGATAAAPTPPAGAISAGEFLLRVFDAGLACCAVEVSAALRRCAGLLPGGPGPGGGAGPGAPGNPVPAGAAPAGAASSGAEADATEARGAGTDAVEAGGGSGPVNVLVVAGTVTDKLAPLVLAAYRDLPEPRRVLSFGACSNSGGPYWDSYCVTKGADQIVPVDVYVPGCPPRPEALVHGLRLLRDTGPEQR
jgi:NADH-quinone oxidoreductase subunit B